MTEHARRTDTKTFKVWKYRQQGLSWEVISERLGISVDCARALLYQLKNRQKKLDYNKMYREKNRKKLQDYKKVWVENNLDKVEWYRCTRKCRNAGVQPLSSIG